MGAGGPVVRPDVGTEVRLLDCSGVLLDPSRAKEPTIVAPAIVWRRSAGVESARFTASLQREGETRMQRLSKLCPVGLPLAALTALWAVPVLGAPAAEPQLI